jgi:hypothetical protein
VIEHTQLEGHNIRFLPTSPITLMLSYGRISGTSGTDVRPTCSIKNSLPNL